MKGTMDWERGLAFYVPGMSFDIAAFIKNFAPSFTHAHGHLDRRIDCPRHFAGFGLRRLLRANDCPHAYGPGERLRPWLSCPPGRVHPSDFNT